MAISEQEKAIVKDLCIELVDVILPKVVAAESQRLPLAYQPIAGALVAALLPALQKALDEKIAAP